MTVTGGRGSGAFKRSDQSNFSGENMTDFQNYEVEFRIKITDGKFSSPESAIKSSAQRLLRDVGVQDANDYMISRFISKYFYAVVAKGD